jgi:hypothetical protein
LRDEWLLATDPQCKHGTCSGGAARVPHRPRMSAVVGRCRLLEPIGLRIPPVVGMCSWLIGLRGDRVHPGDVERATTKIRRNGSTVP